MLWFAGNHNLSRSPAVPDTGGGHVTPILELWLA